MPSTPPQTVITLAASLLQQGGLVAFPTETVYGLGADASNPEALERLYRLKGRPTSHPVIVHVATVSQLTDWAIEVPKEAYLLAEAFWPGPMTLIFKRAPHVLDAVTGGQDTIGIRIPNHPVALELLHEFGGGIAAPSANRFGKLSPTSANMVAHGLGNGVELILDGGPCQVGIESTIIDCSGINTQSEGQYTILRPGMLSITEIQNVLRQPIDAKPRASDTPLPRVSGSLSSHYAPNTPTYLLSAAEIRERIEAQPKQRGLLLYQSHPELETSQTPPIIRHLPFNAQAYAQGLYQALLALDQLACEEILVEMPPPEKDWDGILDRLRRACH